MLVEYAKDELQRAGLFDKTADYDGEVGKCVMELIEVLSRQEHSGGSIQQTVYLFQHLAQFKPLTPLTSDPSEWLDRTEESGGQPLWQSKRSPSVFSVDGGQTWYDLNDAERNQV